MKYIVIVLATLSIALLARYDEIVAPGADETGWYDRTHILMEGKSLGDVLLNPNMSQPHYIRHGDQFMEYVFRIIPPTICHAIFVVIFSSLVLIFMLRYRPPPFICAAVCAYLLLGWPFHQTLWRHTGWVYWGIPVLLFMVCMLYKNRLFDIAVVALALLWNEAGIVVAAGIWGMRTDRVTRYAAIAMSASWLVYRQIVIPPYPYGATPEFMGLVETFSYATLGAGFNSIPEMGDQLKYILWCYGSIALRVCIFFLLLVKYMPNVYWDKPPKGFVAMTVAAAPISVYGGTLPVILPMFMLPLMLVQYSSDRWGKHGNKLGEV